MKPSEIKLPLLLLLAIVLVLSVLWFATTCCGSRLGVTSYHLVRVRSSVRESRELSGDLRSASRAAPWTARDGVGSHAEPVALVGECSEFEVEALPRHATLDVADTPPRVQPRAEGPEQG